MTIPAVLTVPPTETVTSPLGVTIPVEPPKPAPPRTFTAEDIERARSEEKDKLYGKLTDFEQKMVEQGQALADLQRTKNEEVESAATKAREEAAEAARKQWEETDSKNLIAGVRTEFEQKIAELEASRETERATFAKEREFTELRDYAQSVVKAALDTNAIAPELAQYVTGNNTSEIDASLEKAKGTTEALLANIAEATAAQRQPPRGVSPTGYAPVGPMDANPSHQTYSAQDIKNMSIEEYAAKRGSFLGAAANSARDRGLFG